MKNTVLGIIAVAFLAYVVVFILTSIDDGASAIAAVVSLGVGTVGGLLFVRARRRRGAYS